MGMILALLLFPAMLRAETQGAECKLPPDEIFERLSGLVVQVNSLSINPFLVAQRVTPRSGTGFVIDGGYILTNYHVVADAREVVVVEGDTVFEAMIVGIDPALDIALLRTVAPPPWATAFDFADPGDLRIGQPAFALGYPLGVGKSISSGIVSGVSRVIPRTTSSWLSPFIQTDAAISPGNSGGPLVDECGRVIGLITSAILDFGAENIGFAIPVEVLDPVVDALRSDGYVSRPWHGLFGQMTTPPILQLLGYPQNEWANGTGFLVETVEPGSAGDVAGLRGGTLPVMLGMEQVLIGGDIITHVNDTRIGDLDTALDVVQSIEIGDRIRLTFLRDGESRSTSVVVGERPILEQEMELYRHR
jgi:S1-C subfamily serine protease